jgi:choline kinase/predicted kinase
MKAIILAAGIGTRLGELGKTIPKCLVEINGKPLLDWQIENLEKCGLDKKDIAVVIGREGECWSEENIKKIKAMAEKIFVNKINKKTSNAYSLRIALKDIDEDLLVIDGDIIFSQELAAKLIQTQKNLILSKEVLDFPEKRNKIILDEHGRVIKMGRDLPKEALVSPYRIYGAMIRIEKRYLKTIKETLAQEKYFNAALDLFIDESCKKMDIYALSDDHWVNANTLENLDEAKEIFSKRFIVLMFGYTAVGKSTLAKKVARIPNTEIFHSAVIRKELNLSPKTPEEANKFFNYRNNLRQEVDKTVYNLLAENAEKVVRKGKNVVLDAGYFFRWQRQTVYDKILKLGPEVFVLKITCDDEEEIKKRLKEREKNFKNSPLNETPSWATYLATKEVTEQIEDDETSNISGLIEYNSLTKESKINSKNIVSENAKKILDTLMGGR